MKGEKIYNSDKNVKYIFKEGNTSVNKLLVIFSGYASKDSNIKHKYNYMNILSDINVHKLFILDDNGQTGSYYLGQYLNFDVDSSVISLILKTARSYSINLEDIITLGSSKGGTAALYFGIKYKLGAVFAGAFQTRIADLITMRRPESTEFLLGNPNDVNYDKRFDQLNSIMFNLLKSPVLSNLYLISSENDWQYEIHVKPFIEKLNELEINYDFHLSPEMKNHSEISIYFPQYFRRRLINEIFNIHFEYLNLNLKSNSFILNEKYLNLSQNQFRLKYIYKINGVQHILESEKEYIPSVPGYYKFFLIVENQHSEIVYQKLIDEKYYDAGVLTEPIIKIEQTDDILMCEIITNISDDLTFAFYIKENGKIIEKIMYQKENSISINVLKGNNYSIQCFIRYKNSTKIVKNSNLILI